QLWKQPHAVKLVVTRQTSSAPFLAGDTLRPIKSTPHSGPFRGRPPGLRLLDETFIPDLAREEIVVHVNTDEQREAYRLSTDDTLSRSKARQGARVLLREVLHH